MREPNVLSSDWPLYSRVHQTLCGFKTNDLEALAVESEQDDDAQLDCGNTNENLLHERMCESNYNGNEDLYSDLTSCDPLKKVFKTESADNLSTARNHISSINNIADQYHHTPEYPLIPSSTDENGSSCCSHETDLPTVPAKMTKLKAETRYFNEMADLARAKRELIELQKKRLQLGIENFKRNI